MSSEPASSGPLEGPIFDHARALVMLADDVELLAEAVAVFVEHVPPQLDELEKALRAGAYEDAERLAHGVKGAALNVHALRFRQKAAEVEASAQKQEAAALALCNELQEEMARFKTHLEHFDWQSLKGRSA